MPALLSDYSSVIAVITLLHDGELGFQTLSEHVHDPDCGLFLLQEAYMRAAYATELESALSKLSGKPVHESGTTVGYIHRRWLDLKAGLGVGTSGMLHSLTECERAVAKAYDLALADKDLDPQLRTLIEGQSAYVHRAYKSIQILCGVPEN